MGKVPLSTRPRREALRRRFLPSPLNLLFLGESPPASGRFFYNQDSGLYRAMREAFQTARPAITEENFLSEFQSSGCYFLDLCLDPVDHLPPAERRAACRSYEPVLARAIQRLKPRAIATVVRSIEANVASAITQAGWQGEVLHLPYPGRWSKHRQIFVQSLQPKLSALLSHLPK